MFERFKARSIRWQIVASAIGPVLLVAFLTIITQPFTLYAPESLSYARNTALKIEMVAQQIRAASTPEQQAAILDVVSKTGLQVEEVSIAELAPVASPPVPRQDVRQIVRDNLPDTVITNFRSDTSSGRLHNVLVVGIGEDRALAFLPSPPPPASWITDKQINLILKVIVVLLPVLLLSLCAASMITAPLLRFADAAEKLRPDDGPDRPFEEEGAAEIRTLAKSLNDMRSRVRSMVHDRTQMLRAISHDLRTPLTRLRLRAERSTQPELRAAILTDIAVLSDMIEDTLTYLNKGMVTEKLLNVDLPSLLGTVCSDFSDMSHNLKYAGPERFAYRCKPRSLARAVTNLVENSTKFAKRISVTLSVIESGTVRISVVDDGPGLPANLRTRVLEPFFKGDTARTSADRSGFGLGLSIVDDIVRAHGGKIELLNVKPHGLNAQIDLPAQNAMPAGQMRAKSLDHVQQHNQRV
ncbi:signal transduction histidine kinase [Phyllobacterium myrsinacearum]|uniref:ATP-binding protein n=1 Tax=Phyllobacterium myrsinacearum TaxID=28101 RepID=UPI00102904D3|nr:ATP-binding protein [Phyllobacterium myrsinacearum]RZS79890.1 signal transduction histidine kinase [Phyllobacterium myrsinacearum]